MSDLEQYTNYFSNLRRAPWDTIPEISKGGAPHKPLLLLALMDLVEQGVITSSFITVGGDLDSLDELFSVYWKSLVPAGQTSSVAFPFANLNSEPFWKLKPIEEQEVNPKDISSVSQLRKVASGAQLDENLFLQMSLEEGRTALRGSLLNSCFSEKAQEKLSVQFNLGESQTSAENSNLKTKGIRYWVCGLGEGARFWDECKRDSTLVFGLDELASLSIYKTKEDLKQAIIKEDPKRTNPYNDTLAGWQFANEIKEGDVIIAKRGIKVYLGYGIVSGKYKHDATRSTYRNVIPVTWKKTGEWIEPDQNINIKTITDITPYPEYVEKLIKLIGIELNGGSGVVNSNTEELLELLKQVFSGYLKQFIDRARSDSQELTQVPIPPDLSDISRKLGISFKTSFGMGYPTKIPWLACLLPGQTASVEGVYPVLLFRKENSEISVNYGVSATAQQATGNWPRKWSNDLVSGLPHFPDKKYGESYTYKSYASSQIDNLEEITDSFIKVISDYLKLHQSTPAIPAKQKTPIQLTEISVKAMNDFKSANLRLQESTVIRYISSLLTKRFVILTGLSGSGKTKLAHVFASWMSQTPDQFRLVAVGADWTSNDNVLGFQDALQPDFYRKPASGALDLILRAKRDPERPYFLILDEMNLSHVERYFADILSAIESGQEIALHSADHDLEAFAGDPLPVPAKICLPENLFVIGTVNIDETTYMFSPKVLDRANVIEFRATVGDIAGFLDAPSQVDMDILAGSGSEFGNAFVSSSQAKVLMAELPSKVANGTAVSVELKQRLTELFGELAPIGAEFGFRTALEVSCFFYHHAMLTGAGWQFKDALDAQIIQKLMPKLHGSDRKLRPTLTKLKVFCETHALPLSLTKVERMLERLTQDGFTSFAEA